MTEPSDDRFEERLRAALRAEADDVRTSHDALERIRARTERRRLPWAGIAWLRPAVAVGVSALIAASVLLSTPQLREHVLPGSFVSAADSRTTGTEPTLSTDTSAPLGGPRAHPGNEPVPPAPRPSPEPTATGGPTESGEEEGAALSCVLPTTPAPRETPGADGADRTDPQACSPTNTPPGPGTPSPPPGEDTPGATTEPAPDTEAPSAPPSQESQQSASAS